MDENELIMRFEGLIYKIAKRFYNVELADLYQAGCIGLINAYRKYDEAINDNFVNFAYMYIFGEMYNLTNNTRCIKLNKEYLRLSKRIEDAKSILYEKLLRYPTNEELCTFLDIDEYTLNQVCLVTGKMISLDETVGEDDALFAEYVGKSEDLDSAILINDSIEVLDDAEKEVIRSIYYDDLTQEEIAEKMGINQVKVSRILAKSKVKMKEYINA